MLRNLLSSLIPSGFGRNGSFLFVPFSVPETDGSLLSYGGLADWGMPLVLKAGHITLAKVCDSRFLNATEERYSESRVEISTKQAFRTLLA